MLEATDHCVFPFKHQDKDEEPIHSFMITGYGINIKIYYNHVNLSYTLIDAMRPVTPDYCSMCSGFDPADFGQFDICDHCHNKKVFLETTPEIVKNILFSNKKIKEDYITQPKDEIKFGIKKRSSYSFNGCFMVDSKFIIYSEVFTINNKKTYYSSGMLCELKISKAWQNYKNNYPEISQNILNSILPEYLNRRMINKVILLRLLEVDDINNYIINLIISLELNDVI